MTAAEQEVDLVTAEIMRQQLYNIAQEMGTVMIRTSGDPIVTEAVDFSTFIADPEGGIIAFSGYMTWHAGPARKSVQHILASVPRDEIYPGDAFICNDPYTTGACHPPDVGIVRPIFFEDELVAWCWSEGHILDVGGMSPGGFAPAAIDCYGEALRFPGIKFMEKGKVSEDVRRLIDANFRLASRNYNDLRCFLAATSVGERRVVDLIARHGLADFRRYVDVNTSLSEQTLRDRITKLPNKTVVGKENIEHNGHANDVFTVQCAMTVEDGVINLDFTGTDPQTDGFVNIAEGAMWGVAVTPLMLMLAPDVAFNEGFFKCLRMNLPEASLVNVQMPAPSSSGHMETGMHVMKLLTRMLSELMAESDDPFVRSHAMAPFHDGWIGGVFAGADDDGNQFVMLDMNGGGAGGGAQTMVDGMDAAGTLTQVSNGLPDIELNELSFPVHYLWRRLNTNSGGPGRFRGGQGIDFAWTSDGVSLGYETVFSSCWQIPPAGVDGGFPGSTSGYQLITNTNVVALTADRKPLTRESITGDVTDLDGKQANVPVRRGDVFIQFEGGGGGLGDPLTRDPRLVAADVRDRYIDRAVAEAVYGVVFKGDSLDADSAATERRRADIRKKRLSESTPGAAKRPSRPSGGAGRPVGFSLTLVSGQGGTVYCCQQCGEPLAEVGEDWRTACARRDRPAHEAVSEQGGWARERTEAPKVFVTEFLCPGCGAALNVSTDVR
ncbi:hydantoinase B/oxoprolinase family protein [Amycolatopsis sp. NPDC006131]|uniref:hydantoinase B/oxoprolinase family protein n=1 Tax=Amycolatopsis sp. NPDC006131 TaxID=3156731 RepID=UPI0033AB1FD1